MYECFYLARQTTRLSDSLSITTDFSGTWLHGIWRGSAWMKFYHHVFWKSISPAILKFYHSSQLLIACSCCKRFVGISPTVSHVICPIVWLGRRLHRNHPLDQGCDQRSRWCHRLEVGISAAYPSSTISRKGILGGWIVMPNTWPAPRWARFFHVLVSLELCTPGALVHCSLSTHP